MSARFDHLLSNFASDLEIFPHQIDLLADRVLLAKIPLLTQSEASFLDQRALTPSTAGAWFSWRQFEEAALGVPLSRPAFIFHVGHCGSTLLSRLVAEATQTPALREPLPLRDFASDAADGRQSVLSLEERRRRLNVYSGALGRGRTGVVVKATSMCCALVSDLDPGIPAAFVFLRPHSYLAALLGGPNSATDLRGFAQMRHRRLGLRWADLPPFHRLSPGQLAALSWLAETTDIAALPTPPPAFDFDAFLADRAGELARLCVTVNAPAARSRIDAALAGPIMSRYAKAPDHPFDAATRAALLVEANLRNAGEIDAGRRFIERAVRESAECEMAAARFG